MKFTYESDQAPVGLHLLFSLKSITYRDGRVAEAVAHDGTVLEPRPYAQEREAVICQLKDELLALHRQTQCQKVHFDLAEPYFAMVEERDRLREQVRNQKETIEQAQYELESLHISDAAADQIRKHRIEVLKKIVG